MSLPNSDSESPSKTNSLSENNSNFIAQIIIPSSNHHTLLLHAVRSFVGHGLGLGSLDSVTFDGQVLNEAEHLFGGVLILVELAGDTGSDATGEVAHTWEGGG